ncbi:glycosyltransferase family 2 protein [Flavobacterium sp. 7A]|uniref:glycosyltransferase family 2 protein n=1 Tax=Flavobacterium sp. 7A TaxID=2940571 RepID=UPI00222640AF|nr:glycosyltransferase family A protein [Flavobacterium sp. 7A]MCW2119456.1 GT2 family glycosyltransferase [Flavobacterium sp. 7A]
MIIVYHQHNKVSRVQRDTNDIAFDSKKSIAAILFQNAAAFPEEQLIWCDEKYAPFLNIEKIGSLCHHQKIMMSYGEQQNLFLQREMGYIEQSPFLKINKKVRYPTWIMSTTVGVIHASALTVFEGKISADADFEYFLNSVAKIGMPNGLFCYSEPQLLFKTALKNKQVAISSFTLFRFVKQHFKKRWLFLLLVNLIIFEKSFPLLPFLSAFFFQSRMQPSISFVNLEIQSSNVVSQKDVTIDVIIPTIGRKKYLYDVLQDLAKQTLLPTNVIIVEQNPELGSVSELDYLTTETWPFFIKHTFTHQAGACNARNLALDQVTSDWVFLGDDDNRFDAGLIEKMFQKAAQYGTTVVTTNYILKEEVQEFNIIHQSGIFGSGNSFVKTSVLQDIRFDNALEFGYGEDTDFGMQLRNHGQDVIYFPSLKITHLKAPIGGFRTPFVQKWDTEKIQPKPSPTVMYVYKKHFTQEQVKGYQLILFLKLIKREKVRNFFAFYKEFKIKWNASLYWANQLSS